MSQRFLKKSQPLSVWLAICCLLAFLNSCGVFQTRTPQPPLSNSAATFQQPDNPQMVIVNLENAIKSLNTQNYLRCLSDSSFMFNPTNSAQGNDPGIWNSWSKTQEQIYFQNLRSAAQNLTGNQLQFTNERYEVQSSTSQQFTANYTLTVVHNRQGVPTVANGQLIFIIRADANGLWYINSWTDISGGGDTFTWSDLKATFIRG